MAGLAAVVRTHPQPVEYRGPSSCPDCICSRMLIWCSG
jgi:hypothetical protein